MSSLLNDDCAIEARLVERFLYPNKTDYAELIKNNVGLEHYCYCNMLEDIYLKDAITLLRFTRKFETVILNMRMQTKQEKAPLKFKDASDAMRNTYPLAWENAAEILQNKKYFTIITKIIADAFDKYNNEYKAIKNPTEYDLKCREYLAKQYYLYGVMQHCAASYEDLEKLKKQNIPAREREQIEDIKKQLRKEKILKAAKKELEEESR